MVQHVVAFPIDHTAFEYCVVESRTAHDLFGGPFRFMVTRAAARSRAQETDQCDLADAGFSRRLNHSARAVDVNTLIRLTALFPIDAGAMRDPVATGKCIGQNFWVI